MIYSKTLLGQSVLQNRSIPMSPKQRSAFILFDGKRDVQEVLKATAGLGTTLDDLKRLVALGLLAPLAAAASVPASEHTAATRPPVPSSAAALPASPGGLPTVFAQAHYSKAYPIATRLTAGLGLRGFRLNLAVEAADNLDKLRELAPRIKEAVGADKFLELHGALYD